MRVLVTGSRTWDRPDVINSVMDIIAENAAAVGDDELVVVHGACFPNPNPDGRMPLKSADYLVDLWVRSQDGPIPVRAERHPADWRQGKKAGPLRNLHMVSLGAHACVAFIRNLSSGSTGCVEMAERAEIHVQVVDYDDIASAS